MTTENIALFQAMGAKMQYLNHRQELISQNVANADTPGYRPKDLTEVDFGRVLSDVTRDNTVRAQSTHNNHMPGVDEVPKGNARKDELTYEVAPAGNAVILEEQMMQANKTQMDYSMLLNLHRKNVGMIRTALGQGGR